MEELPPDFWDTPPQEAVSPAPSRPAPTRAESAESDDPAPTELEQAFEQLQSLFPGRVVEVRPQTADDGALDEAPAAPHDEEAAEGGYDDDDQDRLSFGPGGA